MHVSSLLIQEHLRPQNLLMKSQYNIIWLNGMILTVLAQNIYQEFDHRTLKFNVLAFLAFIPRSMKAETQGMFCPTFHTEMCL